MDLYSGCSSTYCPDGNCAGCYNGKLWCGDSRCSPYCQDCVVTAANSRFENMLFIVLILGFMFILFLFIMLSGNTLSRPAEL